MGVPLIGKASVYIAFIKATILSCAARAIDRMMARIETLVILDVPLQMSIEPKLAQVFALCGVDGKECHDT